MSSIDLALLGLLKKRPMSAYELNRHAASISLNKWVQMGSSTTYHNLKKLAAAGYLDTRKVRDGEMPEKTIYTLTAAGEEHFLDLMRHLAGNPGSLAFEFNAMVANLDHVERDTALELLQVLRAFFRAAQSGVEGDSQHLTSIPRGGRAVLRLYQLLVHTLNQWVEEQIAAYSGDDARAPSGAKED